MTHITILLQYTIEIENARYSKNNYWESNAEKKVVDPIGLVRTGHKDPYDAPPVGYKKNSVKYLRGNNRNYGWEGQDRTIVQLPHGYEKYLVWFGYEKQSEQNHENWDR